MIDCPLQAILIDGLHAYGKEIVSTFKIVGYITELIWWNPFSVITMIAPLG